MTAQAPSIEVVTTREGFESLADVWGHLLRQNGEDSPFLTHDWHRCCIEAEPSLPLRVVLVRSGSTVTAIAPLWLKRISFRGLSTRALVFISSSETAQSDFIVHPGAREEALRALLRHFAESRRAPWDVVSLMQWPSESVNLRVFTSLVEEGRVRSFSGISSVTIYVPIEGDWEAFWKSRSYLFRKSRRGIQNRLNRSGEVEVVLLEGDRAEEAFSLYRAVASRGWKHREGLSLSSRPATERFLRCLSTTAGRQGWLMVWVLRIRGNPVAAEFDLSCGGRVYALRADFDEDHASYSPGAYLEYHILKHLFERGYREYNAGPGREAYKTRWTESERTNQTVTICRASARGLAVWLLEGHMAPRVRRIRGTVGGLRGSAG